MEESEDAKSPFHEIIDRKSREFNVARGKARTSLYASDFGQCPRKVFYGMYPEVFPAEEIDARTARIFANGESVHTRLQKYLADEERIEFESELNVPRDELDVHGRCDGTAFHEGRVFILEFKSINKMVVDEAKSEHIGQIMWYMGMFEKVRRELREEFDVEPFDIVVDVDELVSVKDGRMGESLTNLEKNLLRASGPVMGEIMYEAKPSQDIFTFPVEYDEKKFQNIRAWFAEVKRAVESGVRPQVRYKPQYYPCAWSVSKCPFFDLCYGDDAVGDAHLITLGVERKKLGG